MMGVKIDGKEANARSKPLSYERCVELLPKLKKYYRHDSNFRCCIIDEGDHSRIYYVKPPNVRETKRKDCAIGQVWSVKVSGRVTHVRILSIFGPWSIGRARRFLGLNLSTKHKISGSIMRLRERVS